MIVGELALPGRRHTRAEVRIVGVPDQRLPVSTITTAVVVPALPSHGFAATLAEAKTAFAAHWRRWLANIPAG